MHLRKLSIVAGIAVAFSLAVGPALAQKTKEEAFIKSYKTPNYKAPRAQDGHADLQGVWSNNNATPLQRPKVLEGKPTFTDDELPKLTVGQPDTPSTWMTAMSAVGLRSESAARPSIENCE